MGQKYCLKKNHFNMRLSFIILFFVSSLTCFAGEESDTNIVKRKWYIPDHFDLQFAGNIGFGSGGFGYAFAKNKLETDLMYGYVPIEFGGPLNSLTLKETYIPFFPVKTGDYKFDLFTIGLYFNYTMGKQFFFSPTSKPQYEAGYYDYSSAFRVGIFAGGGIQRLIDNSCFEKIGLYYEVGTYDLALHNYIFNVNKSSFKGLFSLALGVKLYLKD